MTRYWLAGMAIVLALGLLSRRGERAGGGSRQPRPGGAPSTPADIDALLQAGQKIEAIKVSTFIVSYRDFFRTEDPSSAFERKRFYDPGEIFTQQFYDLYGHNRSR